MTKKTKTRSTPTKDSPNKRQPKTPRTGGEGFSPIQTPEKTDDDNANATFMTPHSSPARLTAVAEAVGGKIAPDEVQNLLEAEANAQLTELMEKEEAKRAASYASKVLNPYTANKKTFAALSTHSSLTTSTSTTQRSPFFPRKPEEDPEVELIETIAPMERPEAIKPVPARIHITRYDIKLNVLPVTNATENFEALTDAIKDFWSTLKEQDSTLVVYPWEEGSKMPTLSVIDRLPKKMSDLQAYFNRAYATNDGGVRYMSVYLGHNDEYKVLHLNVKHILDGNRLGWYKKSLQVEKAVCIGWILYSTRDIDLDMLTENIFKMSGARVGLRWRAISLGRKLKLKPEQLVWAVHVEVDSKFAQTDRRRVEDLYSSAKKEGFPLGVKGRLVPQFSDTTDPESAAFLDRLRLRQAVFLANMLNTSNDDIQVLDFPDHMLDGRTMRDLIMSIKTKSNPTKSVFVSVDKHYSGNGVLFQFTTRNNYEARARINGMLPFLLSQFPNRAQQTQIEKCFSHEALSRAKGSVWDPVRKCVVSRADNRISELFAAQEINDDEYFFPQTDTSAFEIDMDAIDVIEGATKRDNDDDDSVPTLATRRKAGKKKSTISSNASVNDDVGSEAKPAAKLPGKTTRFTSSDTTTVNSSASMDSFMSRLSTVEFSLDQLKTLTSDMQDLKRLIAQSLNRTGPNSSSQQLGQATLGKPSLDADSSNAVGDRFE
jgi:hypothetical protein